MSVKREENVIELKITVYDTVFVKVLERKADLRGIEPTNLLASLRLIYDLCYSLCSLCAKLSPLNVQHQITTTNILHDEVNSRLSLEAGMKVEQERMAFLVCNQENALLGFGTFDFIILDNEFLLQYLNRVELFR